MDIETARARLARMVAADQEPTLDSDAIDELLAMAVRPDAAGLISTEDGYVTTWDLNAAAAEGWRWKAAQVANRFDFGADGQTFSRSDFLKHCLEMADRYSKRYASSVKVPALEDDWHSNYLPLGS